MAWQWLNKNKNKILSLFITVFARRWYDITYWPSSREMVTLSGQWDYPDGLDFTWAVPLLFCFISIDSFWRLDRPQLVAATAQVIFHRFHHVVGFQHYGVLVSSLVASSEVQCADLKQKSAMSAIFLASKIEERPPRLRHIILVAEFIRQRTRHLPFEPMEMFGNVHSWRTRNLHQVLIES